MSKMRNISNRIFCHPKNKSPKIMNGIKYFAAIGTGKNNKANFASLKYKPKATKTP